MVLPFQIFLLKGFGLVPLADIKTLRENRRYRIFWAVLTVAAISFLIGTAFSCGIIGGMFIYGVVYPDIVILDTGSPHQDPLILRIMQLVPYIAVNLRAFVICFIAFRRRQAWMTLLRETGQFLSDCFPSETGDGNFTKTGVRKYIRRVSVITGLIAIVVDLLWECGDWVMYLDGYYPNITIDSPNGAAPLDIAMNMRTYIAVWTLFATVPFILSQQVFLCCIVLAVLMHAASKRLLQEIRVESALMETRSQRLVSLEEKEVMMLQDRLDMWVVLHMRILMFCRKVVKFFSSILFVTFGLDIITLTGFLAIIVKNPRSDVFSYVYFIGSSIIFMSYVTVFVFPLVAVHEKGMELGFEVHRLGFLAEQCRKRGSLRPLALAGSQTNGVHSRGQYSVSQFLINLARFESSVDRHVFVFHALDLVHYSREVLARVCTFLVSFFVVAREFFVKEEVAGSSISVAH